jgi:hypothetical protein
VHTGPDQPALLSSSASHAHLVSSPVADPGARDPPPARRGPRGCAERRDASRVGAREPVHEGVGLDATADGKKPITQDTYDEWRVIQGATLSQDGKWAVYTLTPVVGEGQVVARSTSGTTEYRAPRGFTGRPQLQAGATGGAFTPQAAAISANGTFVVFLQYASRAEYERVRGRRGATQPTNALGLMSLADGKVTTVPRVRSYQLARNGGRYVAYLLEDSVALRAEGAGQTAGAAAGLAPAVPGAARDTTRPAGPRREYGSTLVLRELATGTESRIEGVTSYDFDENERWLGYTITTRAGATDGRVRALAAVRHDDARCWRPVARTAASCSTGRASR